MEKQNPGHLDSPVWHALSTTQSALGEGTPLARRYHPDVAPFAGIENTTLEAFQALMPLIPQGGFAFVPTLTALPPMEGIHHEHVFSVIQMVDCADALGTDEDDATIVQLGTTDVPDMMALAGRTRPGPFCKRTIEMGDYVGIRVDGELIAMAGERMCFDGYVEISAVCVDESHRGKSIARRLMNRLRREIRARGDIPFLHVKDDNDTAIALYERMGFVRRQTLVMHRIAHET
ncbi:GCN5 family acetyltransferase [Pandoraea capi]|uniref:GCN5 family acetyltransferase n=1 Tax=Pandoraea capi TaxID=2508286 RepID=A0ABY6VV28_9BURK|nr:GNAT family N-acetyltransferase [Pandoraea capi]VVD66324.1 GCN5 family acetyltransferase [Pandoraea capi]